MRSRSHTSGSSGMRARARGRGDSAWVSGLRIVDDGRSAGRSATDPGHRATILPATRPGRHAPPRVAPTCDAARVAAATPGQERRRGDLEQSCLCEGSAFRAWDSPPLLLPHADAVCVDFESEKDRFPRATRPAARLAMAWFRRWDHATRRRSTSSLQTRPLSRRRISRYYDRSAQVIHPPVRTDRFTPGGERTDAFLYVGRLVGYKRTDLVVEAFAGLAEQVVIVGEGHLGAALRARATPNVSFVGEVDEQTLIDLYRSARALVFPAEEDFGINMAEAQACGTPVIGLNRGGAKDIVEHGVDRLDARRPHRPGGFRPPSGVRLGKSSTQRRYASAPSAFPPAASGTRSLLPSRRWSRNVGHGAGSRSDEQDRSSALAPGGMANPWRSRSSP